VILFDDIVQVGTISNLDRIVPTLIEFVIHAYAAQSGVGGLEAIQSNYSRLAVAFESFTEEGLGTGGRGSLGTGGFRHHRPSR